MLALWALGKDGEGGERRGLLRDEQLYTLALRGHERGGCNAQAGALRS